MKYYLCFFLSFLFLATSLTAQNDEFTTKKDRSLKNGFSFQLELGAPSSAYGLTDNPFTALSFNNGALFGIQIGNRWYLSGKKNML